MTPTDATHLRRAIALAQSARDAGGAPFGAVLLDAAGAVAAEAANDVHRTGDATAHAEMLALRAAGPAAAGGTLYASTEPCAMCATAAVVAGVARIVFGLREAALPRAMGGPLPWQPLALPVTEVAARSPRPLRVDGPWLEDEAARPHERLAA